MSNLKRELLNQILSSEGNGDEVLPYDAEIVADRLEAVNKVSETADVVRAAGVAAEYQEASDEAQQAGEELSNVRDVVEVVNGNESWSPESFTLLQIQLESLSKRLEIDPIQLGVTIDDVKAGKVKVSVEEMDKILTAINASSADLEERSISALVDLLMALGDAVPKLSTRLKELSDRVETASDRPNLSPVSFDGAPVAQRLVVNNEVPAPLSNYINEYTRYGSTLLTKYSEVAFQSVMKSSLFQSGVTELSFAGFWDGIDEKLKQIKDPRRELSEAQIQMTLPGAGPLFNAKTGNAEPALTVRERLKELIESNSPVSLSDFAVEVQVDEGKQELPALQPSEIRDCVRYLLDFTSSIDIRATADNCKASWVDASRTHLMVRETLKSCDDSLLAALDGDDRLLPSYLSTLFTLSAWPVLNYLTNLVLFTNAFVTYAEVSLKAEPAETTPTATSEEVPVEGSQPAEGGEVEVGEGETAESGAELETEDKPTQPSEVPDTGETPDQPQDATGDGERAVVENVEETIQEGAAGDEEAAGDEGVDVGADADDGTAVDVSATDDGNDAADVGAEEGDGESSDKTEEETKPEGEEDESEEKK